MTRWKRILVGVDGSEPSLAALRWAGDLAMSSGSDLTVILAWTDTPPPPSGPSSTYSLHDDGSSEDLPEARLLAAIHDVLGDDPPILVQPVVKDGNAAEVLVGASSDADLLVVGTRGLGGVASILLGSVSRHVAAHAKCSVVVVR